jgi:lipopolysaccharide/colanic/teichoic acid biosynthesis glycosyltransferase
MKRIFDILLSLIVLIILMPVFLILALVIIIDSPGGPFYKQERIGKDGEPFLLLKFRSMHPFADKRGKLTVGTRDPRITRMGRFIRKFKLDEFPQLINVIKGEMSIVGPRPEVAKYVDVYTSEQKKVLTVRPGLTDYASLKYFDENELLAKAEDPQKEYIEVIMPAKLKLNLEYIEKKSLTTDLKIIFKTFWRIVGG